ncbi:MAG: ANTAR domain-containing protein [Clostridia bacterium]|jgi:two-component system, response regulator PdtaR|nr:ANTAR domain-containing protein [Clostridia bacterium]MBT7121913.1 ANTAR domain-containing protein [Clostridia bacterium]
MTENTRITVALHNVQAAQKIKYALQRNGYSVDICTSSSEVLRRVRQGTPDILLINYDMPDMTGLETAAIIGDENICSVILLIKNEQRKLCIGQIEDYDITLHQKPINRIALLSTIDTVIQSRRRVQKLSKELKKLKRGMEERKIIDRAKGILMQAKSISEAEAYRRIQKMSMDSRVSMKDISQKIIELAHSQN